MSGAIKRRGGRAPFRELARHGPMPLGSAVWTGPGRLPFRGIIHVAGIDLLWRASPASITASVRNAVALAVAHAASSLALPVIGAGSGGLAEERAAGLIAETIDGLDAPLAVTLVRFERGRSR